MEQSPKKGVFIEYKEYSLDMNKMLPRGANTRVQGDELIKVNLRKSKLHILYLRVNFVGAFSLLFSSFYTLGQLLTVWTLFVTTHFFHSG